MSYIGSYIWALRQDVGHRELLVPGAQVLLIDPAGVVFQRRTDTAEWEIPAGSAEPGQSFVDAAVAEVYEELGFVVARDDLRAFASFSDPVKHRLVYPSGDVVHAFALCFVSHRWLGSLAPDPSEVVETTVCPLDFPPTPLRESTRIVLDLYREYMRTSEFQIA